MSENDELLSAVPPASEQPEDWDDADLDDDGWGDEQEERREPRNYGEIEYSGIVEGEVDGMWLLSYWTPEDDVTIHAAVFDTREAALSMAAQIDKLTGIDRIWRVDTVFLNPPDPGELVAMLEGTGGENEA